MTLQQEIAALEQSRKNAIVAVDKTALAALLSDDLIWTHANGAIDSKASYLAALGAKARFTAIATVDEIVAVYTGAAAITAELLMTIKPLDKDPINLRTRASSVWALEPDGKWRLVRFHSGMVS